MQLTWENGWMALAKVVYILTADYGIRQWLGKQYVGVGLIIQMVWQDIIFTMWPRMMSDDIWIVIWIKKMQGRIHA